MRAWATALVMAVLTAACLACERGEDAAPVATATVTPAASPAPPPAEPTAMPSPVPTATPSPTATAMPTPAATPVGYGPWAPSADRGPSPLDVPPGRYTAISVGAAHACAITEDAEVVCWGANEQGHGRTCGTL